MSFTYPLQLVQVLKASTAPKGLEEALIEHLLEDPDSVESIESVWVRSLVENATLQAGSADDDDEEDEEEDIPEWDNGPTVDVLSVLKEQPDALPEWVIFSHAFDMSAAVVDGRLVLRTPLPQARITYRGLNRFEAHVSCKLRDHRTPNKSLGDTPLYGDTLTAILPLLDTPSMLCLSETCKMLHPYAHMLTSNEYCFWRSEELDILDVQPEKEKPRTATL